MKRLIESLWFLIEAFLLRMSIKEIHMENIGYTGPCEFCKHTLTARWACVWAPGSGVSLWIRLLNKHSSLNWPTCAASLLCFCQSWISEMTPPARCTFTHLLASDKARGSARSLNDWVRVAAKGFKQYSVVLRKSVWEGCQPQGETHYERSGAIVLWKMLLIGENLGDLCVK